MYGRLTGSSDDVDLSTEVWDVLLEVEIRAPRGEEIWCQIGEVSVTPSGRE